MSHERAALIALTGFEFRRGLARQGARTGLALFVIALVIGAYHDWSRDDAGASMFVEGYLVWIMGLVAFGMASDRRQSFDAYMIRNHVRARTYLGAKVAAMIGLILIAGSIAFLLRVAATRGDIAMSLWYASLMSMIALMVAPIAMILEAEIDTLMPAAFVVLAYVVVGGVIMIARQSTVVFDVLGLGAVSPGSWPSLGPVALRTAILLGPGFLIAGALVRLNLRRY